jgi:hypothetical protein
LPISYFKLFVEVRPTLVTQQFHNFFADKAFAGASVGYFTFLSLLAGRALAVLLSPPIVVYSPRVLPVYVYDAHADCGKNVRYAAT